MNSLAGLFITAVFVENLALTFFLGMCTFLAISKKNRGGVRHGNCRDRRPDIDGSHQ